MRVLVVGGGGREAAIAWACRRHGHDVIVAPDLGEAGPSDIDLVVPGPEAALAAGIADECVRRGLPCFGPTATLAQLESSKSYARALATELGIPGPRFARFTEAAAAVAWWRELGVPVVVKLDGLAGGKGVTVPDGDLISATLSVEEIRQHIGADSLAFLSLDGMMRAIGSDEGYCNACFTGVYPIAVDEAQAKLSFEGALA